MSLGLSNKLENQAQNTIRTIWLFSMHACVRMLSCLTLQLHGLQPASLLCLWNFPGKNTGMACHFLLQWIFSTQGSNPHLLSLLHCLLDLYHLTLNLFIYSFPLLSTPGPLMAIYILKYKSFYRQLIIKSQKGTGPQACQSLPD